MEEGIEYRKVKLAVIQKLHNFYKSTADWLGDIKMKTDNYLKPNHEKSDKKLLEK